MVCIRLVNTRPTRLKAIQMKNQVFTDTMLSKLMVTDVSEESVAFIVT